MLLCFKIIGIASAIVHAKKSKFEEVLFRTAS